MRGSRIALAGLAAALCLPWAGCANGMFYLPTREIYGTPESAGLTYEEVSFKSLDGTGLSGWFVPAVGKAKGTVVHFHGNAQNMTAHFPFVKWIPREGFNLFTFDYRGYGKSEGVPGRRGVFEDCVAALGYVRGRRDVDPDALLVLGQSLGGANAVAVIGGGRAKGVAAVAIESSFYSYRRIARDRAGGIPVISLLRWPISLLAVTDGWSPGPVIGKVSPIPLLIFHGTDDEVVPYEHGEMLFRAAGEPKEFVPVPGGGHIGALDRAEDDYRRRLISFYEAALARRRGP